MEAKTFDSHKFQVLKVLQVLKEASHQLQSNSTDSSIKAMLDLEFVSDSILSSNPHLATLSSHLSDLKNLIKSQQNLKPSTGIRSFLSNKIQAHEISRVAGSIESEIQAWIDRVTVVNLTRTLEEWSLASSSSSSPPSRDEESLLAQLDQLRSRLTQGFDIDLQDMLLKSRLLQELELLLCNEKISKRVREMAAYTIKELVLFNKDVFVGEVLVGQKIKSLVSMGSFCSLDVLKSLIKAIKSPLVDELESFGGILKIVNSLDSTDLATKTMAIECLMEIGHYGRKEAVEGILNAGIIKKLVYLQRSELGKNGEFVSCVARFAVEVEAGEGLRQREKTAFKKEILKRVREASVSDAEAATIVAEVLWCSSL